MTQIPLIDFGWRRNSTSPRYFFSHFLHHTDSSNIFRITEKTVFFFKWTEKVFFLKWTEKTAFDHLRGTQKISEGILAEIIKHNFSLL